MNLIFMYWKLTNLMFCLTWLHGTMPCNLNKEFYDMTGSYLISNLLLTPILIFLLSMGISNLLIDVLARYGIKPI